MLTAILSCMPLCAVAKDNTDFTFADFGDFAHNWHFVTTRFRRDNAELRFVYANDIAWDALQKNSDDYPDGAAFAKLAVKSEDDPSFPDSLVPSGSIRVQGMIRNHAKYASTDGWGYALYPLNNPPREAGPKEQQQACNACHLAVKDRGLIFSRIPSFLGGALTAKSQADVHFETAETSTLPAEFKNMLPHKSKQIRLMHSPLTEHTFFGSINESKMLMGMESLKSNLPVGFISKHGNPAFAAVWPASGNDKNPDGSCHLPGEQSGKMITGIMISVEESAPADQRYHAIGVAEFCAPLQ